jgi:RloB-like protein
LEKFDHVWAVIDSDAPIKQETWSDVVQKARDLDVKIAQSTPCFEYWLLLHLQYTTRTDLVDGKTAKDVLGDVLKQDYSTNHKTASEALKSLLPSWPQAVANAERVRKYHQDANTVSPANPSTDIDLIVSALNDSALKHHRRIPCREI